MNRDQTKSAAMTIRRMDLENEDRDALARLAQLDSRNALEGTILGAEVEGRLLAAISVDSGAVIADPFSRTVELRTMLELRADQLRRRESRRAHRLRHRHGQRRSPLALGGSPAGQIIHMPNWG